MPSTRKPVNSLVGVIIGVTAAFATYFCMYAFRKPFTVATYEGYQLWGIDYKIVLIITQVLGYTLSKFSGIKIIAEMPPSRRIAAILVFIGTAELALVLFGLVPPPFNVVFLFMNGLPLGLIWGIVFSFVEGRRYTELLGAALCVSFILSSGVVKSVGGLLMSRLGVGEFWMPAATGLVFTAPLLLSVWALSLMPPPSLDDEKVRTRRVPMDARRRRDFFFRFAPGIVLLVTIYATLNTYRDFRDNFAVELWTAFGYSDAPAVFTLSEIPIALVTFVAIGSLILIKDNRHAFWLSLGTVILGAGMIGVSTATYQAGILDPAIWMVVVGLGMYVPYIAFHVMVFERMIAMVRYESNIGYLMYIADAFGYLGSTGVMLYRDFGFKQMSWVDFFVGTSYIMSVGCVLLTALSVVYFRRTLTATRIPQAAAPRVNDSASISAI